jgi:hypothetical protein
MGIPARCGRGRIVFSCQKENLLDTTTEALMVRKTMASVKIDPEVYHLCKIIAAWKEQDVSEYLSDLVRPMVRREFKKMAKAAIDEKEESE